MSERAVSPVVGLVVLLGLVALSSVAIFVVGGSVTDSTVQQAHTEQTERSLTQFAETANQLPNSEQRSDTFTIEAGDQGNAWVDESAGHVELELVLNQTTGDTETVLDQDMGAYVTEPGDDTHLAYQGGGVWRVDDDGEATIVRPPTLEYSGTSTPTLTVPAVQIRGNDSGTAGSGALDVQTRRDAFPNENVSNPLIGDYMTLSITSQYCGAWERYAADETQAAVTESCDQGTPDQVVLRMDLAQGTTTGTSTTTGSTDPGVSTPSTSTGTPGIDSTDLDEGTSPDTPPMQGNLDMEDPDVDEPEEWEPDGVHGFYSEGPIDIAGNSFGNIQGSMASGGDVDIPHQWQVSNGTHENVPPHSDPYPDVEAIVQRADASDWEPNIASSQYTTEVRNNKYRIDSAPGGRTIYVNDTDDLSTSGEYDFDLSQGDISVVVDGDFSTAGRTNIEAINTESNNHTLTFYVDGDVAIYRGSTIGTEDHQAQNLPGGVNEATIEPNVVTIYGSDDSDFDGQGSLRIEGNVILPGGTGVGSASLQMIGSFYVGTFQGSSFSAHILPAGTVGRSVETDPGPGAILGTVYNGTRNVSDPGAGIDNVDVTLTGTDVSNTNTTVTGADGSYYLPDVPPGNYTLEAEPHAGVDYNDTTVADVRIVGNGTTAADIPLEPQFSTPSVGTLEVNLEDTTGNAVGSDVSISGPTSATDDPTGATAQFTGLSPGDYSVDLDPDDASYPNTLSVPGTSEVVPGDITYVNVTLDPPTPSSGSLVVNVYDNGTASHPPLDADLTIESLDDGDTTTVATTDASPQGEVTVSVDAGEDYDVTVDPHDSSFQSDSLGNHSKDVEVVPGDTSTVDFPVVQRATSSSSVTVVTSSGSPGDVHYLHVSETVVEVEDD